MAWKGYVEVLEETEEQLLIEHVGEAAWINKIEILDDSQVNCAADAPGIISLPDAVAEAMGLD